MPENLKNVLLFMSSSGYLVPPSQNPEQEQLWVETWKRIDRFLPDLKNELFMDDLKAQQEPQRTSAESQKEAPKAEEKAA